MIPGAALSTTPVPDPFVGGRANRTTRLLDYEDGGLAIGDASMGSQYQQWRCRLVGNDVILDAANVAPVTIYSGTGITEISFTFDQAMRHYLAFVQDGIAKLQWYDATLSQVVVTSFGADVKTPRVFLDDKRLGQVASSDVILAYIRLGQLCYRQQRDRFTIEYILDAGPHTGLHKVGMNSGGRLQFMFYRQG